MRERRDGSTHRTRLRPACQAPVWWTAGRSRRTCGVCAFDCFGTRQVSSGSSVRCVDVDVEATHCVDLYSNGEDSTDSTQFVQKTRCSPPGEHSGQRARERPAGCGRAQPGRPPAAALRRPHLLLRSVGSVKERTVFLPLKRRGGVALWGTLLRLSVV
jgi:hypothetical protein